MSYIFIAVLLFSFSALINKSLIENNKSLGFDSIYLVIGITMFLINIFLRENEITIDLNQPSKSNIANFSHKNINNYLFHNDEKTKNSERNFLNVFSEMKNELKKDFSSTCFFLIRCCLGTFADIFFFLSLKELRLNTANTLFAVYPIISAPIFYAYLEAKDSKSSKSRTRDFLFLVFCLFFVSFITKPEFVFGALDDTMKPDSFAGFIIIALAVLCNAFSIVFHKKVADKFNNYTFNIFSGFNFILFALLLVIFDKFTVFHLDFSSFFMLLIMALCLNISQTLFNLSLKLGEIVVVLPITYLDIVLGFFYNIIFFNGFWDHFDLLGSFGIIFINVYRIVMISGES